MVVSRFEIVRLMSNLDEAKHETKVCRSRGKYLYHTNSNMTKFFKKSWALLNDGPFRVHSIGI